MTEEFWERCVKAGCVIVPVKTYASWGADGFIDDGQFLGIFYVALPFEDVAVGPDYWIMLDEQAAGFSNFRSTPEAALSAFENMPPDSGDEAK